MKIRNGFVSNSSSSSYIISYDTACTNIRGYMDYNKIYSESKAYVNAIGIKEIVDMFRQWYDIDIDCECKTQEEIEYHKEMFAKFAGNVANIAQYVEDGKELAYITIPYGDDTLEKLREDDSITFVKSYD